ncbi:type II toxin-antitoxin system HicB family antitoxin [Aquiflexum sp.]|uniref:type II toxin-antitoxin system HicB family antitoxin n=1 Tax=Aquiflexum sp. TaxID=1872584 RepID=UPI00359388D8
MIIYWSKENDAFIAEIPELTNLMVHGDSANEALENAQTAIDLWIKVAIEEGLPIPEPKGKLMFA